MITTLLEPFQYSYMTNAMWVSALVGGVCAFLSAYLMLKGWSLIGDALSHSIVPGVAGAYMLGLPFAFGASPRVENGTSKPHSKLTIMKGSAVDVAAAATAKKRQCRVGPGSPVRSGPSIPTRSRWGAARSWTSAPSSRSAATR